MNITSILPELVKTRTSVQKTIDDCKTFIENTAVKDAKSKAAIRESQENLKSLELTLEKLDKQIRNIKGLH